MREPVIRIVTGFPGVGKSYYMLHEVVPRKLLEGKRVLYLVPSHDRVDEFYETLIPENKRLGEKLVQVKRTACVWRGVQRACPLFKFVNCLQILEDHQKVYMNRSSTPEFHIHFTSAVDDTYNILSNNITISADSEAVKQATVLASALLKGFPPSIVCAVCTRLKLAKRLNLACEYKKQFRRRKKLVISVHNYVSTKYPKNFDVIVLDDLDLLRPAKLLKPPRREEIRDSLRDLAAIVMRAIVEDRVPEPYSVQDFRRLHSVLVEASGIEKLEDSLNRVIEGFREVFGEENWFDRSYKDWFKLIVFFARNALEWGLLSDALKIFKLLDFLEWLYFYSFYRKIQEYARPLIFYAFDWALEGKEVYIVSANFISKDFQKLLERMLERYLREDGCVVDYEIHYLTPPDGERGRVCFYNKFYFGGLAGRYPVKGSLLKHPKTLENVLRKVKAVARLYGVLESGEGLGIVTGKDLVDKIKEEFPKAEVVYYWNLEGSNKLKDCKVLILVGTPEVGGNVVEIARVIFPYIDVLDEEPKLVSFLLGRKYRDPLLDLLNSCLVDMELFQAIHRGRSIRQKLDVFVFGKPIALTKEVGLDTYWFDVDEENKKLYLTPIMEAKKIRIGFELKYRGDKKKITLYGDLEEFKKLNAEIRIKGEYQITIIPEKRDIKLDETIRYAEVKIKD